MKQRGREGGWERGKDTEGRNRGKRTRRDGELDVGERYRRNEGKQESEG
jgi:hypothetical protein